MEWRMKSSKTTKHWLQVSSKEDVTDVERSVTEDVSVSPILLLNSMDKEEEWGTPHKANSLHTPRVVLLAEDHHLRGLD